jgi:thiol-disulfide isomerase/thioredoxin
MNATTQGASDLWLDEMYNSIKSNYSGFLRDNLLVAALRSFSVFLLNQELIEYINDALLFAESDESKNALWVLLESVTPGTKVQYFEFNTREGAKVSIEDFKGKVIMAHFWSLGCVPCIEMTKNLHPLINKYSDNPNIVFLSINVNSSLKHWDSGLSSNRYSQKKELQLNVGELGIRHPLLQYYNYDAVPQIMVIGKDGSLVTSNAPRARNLREYNDLESVISSAIVK